MFHHFEETLHAHRRNQFHSSRTAVDQNNLGYHVWALRKLGKQRIGLRIVASTRVCQAIIWHCLHFTRFIPNKTHLEVNSVNSPPSKVSLKSKVMPSSKSSLVPPPSWGDDRQKDLFLKEPRTQQVEYLICWTWQEHPSSMAPKATPTVLPAVMGKSLKLAFLGPQNDQTKSLPSLLPQLSNFELWRPGLLFQLLMFIRNIQK